MKTVTRNLTLVSSKLRKYDHDINDYVFIEDESQASRLNQTIPVSYVTEKGVNYIHSYDEPAMGKEFYINGLKYTKNEFADVIRLMKKEETLKNN
jgi:hypothetical protein